MATLCVSDGCSFYGTPEQGGRCSEHSDGQRAPRTLLNENDILRVLGKTAEEVFVEDAIYAERLFWIVHHGLPMIHCDDLESAEAVLGMPHGKALRVNDAIRMMNEIDKKNPFRYTRIALEKVLVIKTLHKTALPMDVFPVGICYHGGHATPHTGMSDDAIRSLFTPSVEVRTRSRALEMEHLTGGAAVNVSANVQEP